MSTLRILRLGDIIRMTGLSKATLYRRIRAGSFPRPVRLGPRARGWREEEVRDWLETLPRADVS